MQFFKKICLLAICILGMYRAGAQTEVIYYTSMGNFNIVLTDTLTPRTVDSFIARVSQKFYDGLIFHRVINNFMIQGGDPLGNGTGGPGYTIPDEFSPTLKNVPGALAMANAGPNTNGCQFYINLVTNSYLNNHYTVFGMTTSGFSVVQAIGRVATNSADKPLVNVVIDSIRIVHLYYPANVKGITKNIAARVYPNPCNGVFTIDLADNTTTRVDITNIAGELVYYAQANGTVNIDLSNRPAGIYIVRMINTTSMSETKLVIE